MAESEGFEPSEARTSPVFKTGTIDQLCQLSTHQNGANGENRTHTPKLERDFKSRASTCSATLAKFKNSILSFYLKWTGIIIAFFKFVKSKLEKFIKFLKFILK